ncbi:MAG TPA: hypothetical protein VEW90_02610 [Gaiellaceae bacterium]|nr:hypothetical protein [Gaiellaceae bacterium]
MNDETSIETRDRDVELSTEEAGERATRDLHESETKDPDELVSRDGGPGSAESSVGDRAAEEIAEASEREPESTARSMSQETAAVTADGALLPDDQSARFRTRWEEIQASFVDEPQAAVEDADALVADLMQRVTSGLTQERTRLEGQWAQGDDVSTEDLRVALTRYRTFFDRLLSA